MTTRRPLGRSATSALGVLVVMSITLVAGCGEGPVAADRLVVLTTSSVFGDMVANVGGDDLTVTSLVPRGADVHTFAPSPADLRAASGTGLFVMNGLGLDDWLESTVVSAAPAGTPVLRLGVDLPGATALAGEEPGTQNPHLWLSVPNAIRYVDRIEAALVSADVAHAEAYRRRAAEYRKRLSDLDEWIRGEIATVPVDDRKLVTFHDAFPYFAQEYDLTIVGVAVQAPGQDPSARSIADLVSAIKASGVKVIFSEDQFPTRLVDQIASETGATVVATLYDDSLGDPPITSYEALMRWDTEQVVEALR